MDALLLGVTIVSLAVALVMSLVAWKAIRSERARSAARVASLAADGGAPRPTRRWSAPPAASSVAQAAPWSPAPIPPVQGPPPARAAAVTSPVRATSPAELYLQPERPRRDELPLNARPFRAPEHDGVPDGFLAAAPQGSGRQRGLALAASVLMIAMLGLGASMFAGPSTTPTDVIPLSDRPPLELMSLDHDQADGTLAISGLVHNPPDGAPVDRLDAVVFLFDREGTFVKSAVSPVDFRHLAPGDDSPFVVRLDAPAGVARYRVSFRTENGVVPHVDRR